MLLKVLVLSQLASAHMVHANITIYERRLIYIVSTLGRRFSMTSKKAAITLERLIDKKGPGPLSSWSTKIVINDDMN